MVHPEVLCELHIPSGKSCVQNTGVQKHQNRKASIMLTGDFNNQMRFKSFYSLWKTTRYLYIIESHQWYCECTSVRNNYMCLLCQILYCRLGTNGLLEFFTNTQNRKNGNIGSTGFTT